VNAARIDAELRCRITLAIVDSGDPNRITQNADA